MIVYHGGATGWLLSAALLISGCTSEVTKGAVTGVTATAGSNATAGTSAGGATSASGGTSASAGVSASGGTSASAGMSASAGAGGTDAGGKSGSQPPPHRLTACPGAAAAGIWENATPPQVSLDANVKTAIGQNYGTNSFVINPQDTSQVYLGTSAQGIYKSTDCGATWTHINTGKNGAALDQGGNWTMAIDPVDPRGVIYTNSGYGPSGVYKSVNGGVDWEQILTGDAAKAFINGGFIERIVMDPTNHLHLIVSPHFTCLGSHAPNCFVETEDGGATWKIIDGAPPGMEGSGQLMLDSNTWLWAEGYGGLWRTADRGGTWTQVTKQDSYAYDTIYRAADGSFYMPAAFSVLQSRDGITWNSIPNSPNASAITGSKTKMYIARGACVVAGDKPTQTLSFAAVSDPTTWTTIDGPPTPYGPGLGYDEDHHILYATSCLGGFWRAVME